MMQFLPSSIRVGVIRGGVTPEYDTSLKTGAYVLSLLSETHKPVDIFISRDGKWHIQGVERSPDRILNQVDVVWNALHGFYGEGGLAQEVLNLHAIPHTSSDRYSSSLASNKWMTKDFADIAGIKTPVSVTVWKGGDLVKKAKDVWTSIPHPYVVKAGSGGGVVHSYIAETFEDLVHVLDYVLSHYKVALVEEYIKGKPVSILTLDNFRGQDVYTFPSLEKVKKGDSSKLAENAKKIHKTLGLKNFSKSDFVVSPRGVYFLEVNTVPKMKEDGFIEKSLLSVSVSPQEFVHHILRKTLDI